MSEEYQFHTRQKSDLFSYPYRMERGELLFCLQGGVQLYINQQKYALAAGSVILVFPEQITFYKDATDDLNWPFLLFPPSSDMRFSIRCLRIRYPSCVSIIIVHSETKSGMGYAIIILNFCNRNLWAVIIYINVSW